MKPRRWNRFVIGLVAVAIALLVLERMIGSTILGNLILIAVGAILLLLAALSSLLDLIKRRSPETIVPFAVSAALILYVLGRFYFDTIPVGYGP